MHLLRHLIESFVSPLSDEGKHVAQVYIDVELELLFDGLVQNTGFDCNNVL